LGGILLIQAWWVKSMLEMRNRQFDNAVADALRAAAGRLEQKENVTIIRQSQESGKQKKQPVKGHSKQVKIISGSKVIRKKGKTISNSYSYTMKNDSVQVKIESFGNNNVSSAFVFNSDNDAVLKLEETEDSSSIDKKMSDIKLLINKIVLSDKDSVQLLPKGPELEKILQKTLQENNLVIPFSIGVSLNGKNFYRSANTDSAAVYSSDYKASLFPDDILNRKAELYVVFPDKRSYLFSEITWILVCIILFTAIIVYLFAYTLINYNRQKKLNQLKSDFINNMTHELKTPLATIQLASDIILKKEENAESPVSQMATTIKTQSKKIDEDIRNMLQIALLENSGTSLMNYTVFQLAELLEMCRDKMQLIAAQKHIQLVFQSETRLETEADADLLQKAISSLIDNAIKYSPEGGRVVIQAKQQNNQLVIQVTDNGIGVQKTDLPYIFEKFYKAGKGNIHYNKGYGLGLSFVKKITLLHGGDAEAISTPGKETIFTLRIPLRK
jgi:two-component system phosphate regulon sensor histidine kinase PhoR